MVTATIIITTYRMWGVGLKYKGTSGMERDTHGKLPFEMLDCQKKRIFFLPPFSKHFRRERAQSQNLGEQILLAHSFQDSPNQDWILSPVFLFTVHFQFPCFNPQSTNSSLIHIAKSKTSNEESHSFSSHLHVWTHAHTPQTHTLVHVLACGH